MERNILHGLVCEWKLAVGDLPADLANRMRVPAFSLAEFSSAWGRWYRERREIAISRRLAFEHPWACVRDVLRHEMAHQVADEALGGDDVPHGVRFRIACRHLHADPAAQGNYPLLNDRQDAAFVSEDDRILLRVRKLLALAQSANMHEAEAAMAKAHEQMARHNLDLLATRQERAYCSVCLGEPALRHAPHEHALAGLLGQFYFVEPVWIASYVPHTGRMGRVLEVSGTLVNVKMAGYVHDFLQRTIETQWAAFNQERRFTRRQRADFALGLIKGFRQKLQAIRECPGELPSRFDVIKVRDRQLTLYIRDRYHRLRTTRGRARRLDAHVHRAGEHAGRSTVLHRPIETVARLRRFLLGG
jgi:hypothetical protein